MKKLLYVFIGMAIALGAVLLYSFKAKENAEVSYAMVMGTVSEVFVYYSDGSFEQATKLFNISIGHKNDKGQIPPASATLKALEHMHQKGYKFIGVGESQPFSLGNGYGQSAYSFTLIKEN